jgi:hypothetical protein
MKLSKSTLNDHNLMMIKITIRYYYLNQDEKCNYKCTVYYLVKDDIKSNSKFNKKPLKCICSEYNPPEVMFS